jgi:hypothetical protein
VTDVIISGTDSKLSRDEVAPTLHEIAGTDRLNAKENRGNNSDNIINSNNNDTKIAIEAIE